MKRLLFILLLMAMIILPASAGNITITAEPLGGSLNILPSHQYSYSVDVSQLQRNAIQRITVDVPTGSEIDYTVWYGNGSSLSGQMIYQPAPGMCGISPICQYSSVSIGASTGSHYYVGLQEIGRIDIIGYGRDETIESAPQRVFIVYDSSFGLHIPGDAMAYTPVPGTGVIYKFEVTSNKQITSLNYYTNTRANVQKASDTSVLDVLVEWGNLLIAIKDSVLEIFWFGYNLAIFLWDNLYLIIALYFAITGAMCVNGQKSIFRAMQKWFKMQQALLQFILGLWDTIIGIITKILK